MRDGLTKDEHLKHADDQNDRQQIARAAQCVVGEGFQRVFQVAGNAMEKFKAYRAAK